MWAKVIISYFGVVLPLSLGSFTGSDSQEPSLGSAWLQKDSATWRYSINLYYICKLPEWT